jgi:hypothetical protein
VGIVILASYLPFILHTVLDPSDVATDTDCNCLQDHNVHWIMELLYLAICVDNPRKWVEPDRLEGSVNAAVLLFGWKVDFHVIESDYRWVSD